MKTVSISLLALLAASSVANATPAGCTAAPSGYTNLWYVDPINGSDAGAGTQASPWKTLQTVLTTKVAYSTYKLPYVPLSALLPPSPKAVVQPGDAILLLDGDHGSINVRNAHNAGYVTITSAPGAHPTLHSFAVLGGSYWAVTGLNVQSLLTDVPVSPQLLSAAANGYWGPLHDITYSGNTLSSASSATTVGWTSADWRAKEISGVSIAAGSKFPDGTIDFNGVLNGTCFTVDNNVISNVNFGIGLTGADKASVSWNKIKRYAGDGIDFSASDLDIIGNDIVDSIYTGNAGAVHRDGMQGQPYWGEQTWNHDVRIIGNRIVAMEDPKLEKPGCLQGISVYNGKWKNILAENNFVVINIYNGLVVAGADGLTLVNNTVLSAADPKACHVGADAIDNVAGAAGPNTNAVLAAGSAWIGVLDGIPGNPTKGAVVRNNIASSYNLSATINPIVWDHNIVAGKQTHIYISKLPYAQPTFIDPAKLFTHFDPEAYAYDATLSAGSPAIGAATMDGAPLLDINGLTRTTDSGAYRH